MTGGAGCGRGEANGVEATDSSGHWAPRLTGGKPFVRVARPDRTARRSSSNLDVCRMVKRRFNNAGLPGQLSPHSLRRGDRHRSPPQQNSGRRTFSTCCGTPIRGQSGFTTTGRSSSSGTRSSGFRSDRSRPLQRTKKHARAKHKIQKPLSIPPVNGPASDGLGQFDVKDAFLADTKRSSTRPYGSTDAEIPVLPTTMSGSPCSTARSRAISKC